MVKKIDSVVAKSSMDAIHAQHGEPSYEKRLQVKSRIEELLSKKGFKFFVNAYTHLRQVLVLLEPNDIANVKKITAFLKAHGATDDKKEKGGLRFDRVLVFVSPNSSGIVGE